MACDRSGSGNASWFGDFLESRGDCSERGECRSESGSLDRQWSASMDGCEVCHSSTHPQRISASNRIMD